MTVRHVSGVVPEDLFEAARQTCDVEGISMSALVSSAVSLYLRLPGTARRTARFVVESGSSESKALLAEALGQAIARAGHQATASYLADRGRALGLQDKDFDEQQITEDSVRLVEDVRTTSSQLEDVLPGPANSMR